MPQNNWTKLGWYPVRFSSRPSHCRPNFHSPANFRDIFGVCQRRLHMYFHHGVSDQRSLETFCRYWVNFTNYNIKKLNHDGARSMVSLRTTFQSRKVGVDSSRTNVNKTVTSTKTNVTPQCSTQRLLRTKCQKPTLPSSVPNARTPSWNGCQANDITWKQRYHWN